MMFSLLRHQPRPLIVLFMNNFHEQALTVPVSLTRFEVGKRYKHGWIGDSQLFTTYTVISRTKHFIQLAESEPGRTFKVKTFNYEGSERCYPRGKYSLCPILSAEKEAK